jgi:ABC-2 type transport system permease protein
MNGIGGMSGIATIVRHDLRILRRDPAYVLIMIAMPLVMMLFLKDTFRLALREAGYTSANGAEQVVPGGVVMFSTMLMGDVAFRVFREHGWGTWDRLRASPISTSQLLVGKSVTSLLVLILQTIVLFAVGLLVLDLQVPGSWFGLIAVAASFWLCLVAIGFALLTLCRTVQQVNAISNVGAMMLSGIGGAFTPLSALPGWAQAISPATPHYWVMRGFRSVLLDGAGLGAVMLPCAVLLGITAILVLYVRLRFDADERKLSWA